MFIVSVLVLLLILSLFAWKFRKKNSLASLSVEEKGNQAVTSSLPAFLPEEFEADELEADDIAWLLRKQKERLGRKSSSSLSHEQTAWYDELATQVDDLEKRVQELQKRMEAWKSVVLERDSLQLSFQQLRNEFLDQQYLLEARQRELESLRNDLSDLRIEAIETHQEKEALRTQVNLLRDLRNEGGPA